MKAWLRITDEGGSPEGYFGFMGTVFAKKPPPEGFRVVEIEIPDPPPHEWKVGDWFHMGGAIRRRIADIVPSEYGANNGVVVTHYRDAYGKPQCKRECLSVIQTDATPCDPPDWWKGD